MDKCWVAPEGRHWREQSELEKGQDMNGPSFQGGPKQTHYRTSGTSPLATAKAADDGQHVMSLWPSHTLPETFTGFWPPSPSFPLLSEKREHHSGSHIPSLLGHGLKEPPQTGDSVQGLGFHSKLWTSQYEIQNPQTMSFPHLST